MRINIFYDYSYLLQGENYIESRPTNKIFLQSVRKQTEADRKQKSGILDMSIPDTPEKVNDKPFSMPAKKNLYHMRHAYICLDKKYYPPKILAVKINLLSSVRALRL